MVLNNRHMLCEDIQNDMINSYKLEGRPIKVSFRSIVSHIKNIDRATHLIHPYPAKLLAHIPNFFLSGNIFSKKGNLVYDPFCIRFHFKKLHQRKSPGCVA